MFVNHNGEIKNAFKIISEAKKMGADAGKIQTHTADTLTLDSTLTEFIIDSGFWAGKSLYELCKLAFNSWEWHATTEDVLMIKLR